MPADYDVFEPEIVVIYLEIYFQFEDPRERILFKVDLSAIRVQMNQVPPTSFAEKKIADPLADPYRPLGVDICR